MKRTRTIRLVLMGISPLILSACNPSVQGGRPQPGEERLYPNADACIASGDFSRADCNAAFAAALEEHQKSAPSFATRAECAQQYGDRSCAEVSSGASGSLAGSEATDNETQTSHSSFMPFMAGMLMGRAFNNGYARPAYTDSNKQTVRPGAGNYWSGGSNPVRQPGAPTSLPPPPQGKIVTQARSGFGSNNTARSGG
jgi:uncharacterized protein YgiB involved in biofilm formation